jgi:hypothetical protein
MPTRLAVGLEAKKSSASVKMLRPAFCFFYRQNIWFPRVVFQKNNFGDLIWCKFNQKFNKNARTIFSRVFSFRLGSEF